MPNLPAGTVTFLFTDIEGSTKLWERHPEVMKAVLARHDKLLYDAIEVNGGIIVKSTGDGCHAVFETALAGVAAALAAQQCLTEEAWPEIQTLRVRMALHTGEAEVRAGDYYGPALNRAARLMSVGAGGQILLSAVTAELVRDSLPDEASLLDLGEHRLKDLSRPEHIYQLTHPSLTLEFPPLKSLEAFPGNLPLQLTSFIGRERDVAHIKEALGSVRLLTLSGAGGAGKTRLALQVAADVLEEYPDGAWLVELAATTDPDLVPATLAAVLGVQESPDRALTDIIMDYLSDKKMFIIFDNCEHLLSACAALIDLLLRACPGLKIMATSREALSIFGERAIRVPSLAAPDPDAEIKLDALKQYEAIQLFVDRAKTVRPDFALTVDNALPITQICYRLDGIPLAIELATTRIRGMSVAQIADRLDDRFRLLTGGSRTALPRQQTLRTMIDWSYGLLSEPERILLRRLSVFTGSWTLEACETVCAGDNLDALDIMDRLMQLVDKSLVLPDERGGDTRYRMLDTIRQYAREKLIDTGEMELLRNRHLDWYVHSAEEIGADPWNRFRKSAVDYVAAESANFRSAMEWSYDTNVEGCLRIGGTLISTVRYFDGYSEWRGWLEMALGKADETNAAIPPLVRAKALGGIGIACMVQGDILTSKAYLEESVAILREVGDKAELSVALGNLSAAAGMSGDEANAMALGQESLQLSREIGDSHSISQALLSEAMYAFNTNDLPGARAKLDESIRLTRENADRWNVAWPLIFSAHLLLQDGDMVNARAQYEECVVLFRELGDKLGLGQVLTGLAHIEQAEGNLDKATAHYQEIVEIWRKVGNRGAVAFLLQLQGQLALQVNDHESARSLFERSLVMREQLEDIREIAGPLEGLAGVATAQGNWSRAAQLLGAAAAIRGDSPTSMESFDVAQIDNLIVALHDHLSASQFDGCWSEGKSLSLDEAIGFALDQSAA